MRGCLWANKRVKCKWPKQINLLLLFLLFSPHIFIRNNHVNDEFYSLIARQFHVRYGNTTVQSLMIIYWLFYASLLKVWLSTWEMLSKSTVQSHRRKFAQSGSHPGESLRTGTISSAEMWDATLICNQSWYLNSSLNCYSVVAEICCFYFLPFNAFLCPRCRLLPHTRRCWILLANWMLSTVFIPISSWWTMEPWASTAPRSTCGGSWRSTSTSKEYMHVSKSWRLVFTAAVLNSLSLWGDSAAGVTCSELMQRHYLCLKMLTLPPEFTCF